MSFLPADWFLFVWLGCWLLFILTVVGFVFILSVISRILKKWGI